MPPGVRIESKRTYSPFCPECNKIMDPLDKYATKFICKDCNIQLKPDFKNLKRVRVSCEMNTYEVKAIDVAKTGKNTVKFTTVDYFPNLIRVEYNNTEFIVDREDIKAMLSETQLLKE